MITVQALPIFVSLLLIWFVPAFTRLKRGRTTQQIELAFSLFVVYLLVVARVTLMPFALRYEPLIRTANLIPWVETEAMIRLGTRNAWTYNVFGNLLMLLPFAFFWPLLFADARRFTETLLYTFLLSLTIEGLQWVMGNRLFDIDDILLNTLGAIPGYVLFLLFRGTALPSHPRIPKASIFFVRMCTVFVLVLAAGFGVTYLLDAG